MVHSFRRVWLSGILIACTALSAPAARAQPADFTLDGLRDDGYQLLAQDPAGDLAADFSGQSATDWADLTSLSVATDTTNLWVYADLPNYQAQSVGEFGLAVDTDGVALSGGAQDPWGNGITFAYTSTHNNVDESPVTVSPPWLPDIVIRGDLFSLAANGDGWTELLSWKGSAWTGAGVNWGGVVTSSIGANIGFAYGHGIEFRLPFSDLGVAPTTTLHLEFYATGANGVGPTHLSGAWDTVPSDAQSQTQYQATAQNRLGTFGPSAPLPSVSFSSSTYAAAEADGSAPITVTVAPVSSRLISVTLTTADGTAGPADYVAISQVFTLAAGVTSRVVPLQILSDALVEPDETVFLGLSAPANAQLGAPLTATVTIHDSPPPRPPAALFLPLLKR